jgi:hypothetical protein
MGVLEGGGADAPFGEHEREVQFFSFAGLGLEGGGADTRMNSAVRHVGHIPLSITTTMQT